MENEGQATPWPKQSFEGQIAKLRTYEIRDKFGNYVNPDFIADRLLEAFHGT